MGLVTRVAGPLRSEMAATAHFWPRVRPGPVHSCPLPASPHKSRRAGGTDSVVISAAPVTAVDEGLSRVDAVRHRAVIRGCKSDRH